MRKISECYESETDKYEADLYICCEWKDEIVCNVGVSINYQFIDFATTSEKIDFAEKQKLLSFGKHFGYFMNYIRRIKDEKQTVSKKESGLM